MTAPGRVFVVGAPRSGTTLLQAMLGAHPDVLTLPESFFFRAVWGRLWPWRRWGIVSPRGARRALRRPAADLGIAARSPRSPFIGAHARAFVALLDEAAVAAGASTWIDKSPGHLHLVDVIERHVPGARFVHVVRDGRAVTASFLAACLDEPDRWMGQAVGRGWRRRFDDDTALRAAALDGIVSRWNGDVAATADCAGRSGHLIVLYDELVTDPGPVLRQVTDALGLPWSAGVLDHRPAARDVVGRRQDRPHMAGVFEPRRTGPDEGRFEEVLDAGEREHVVAALTAGGDPRAALGARGYRRPG